MRLSLFPAMPNTRRVRELKHFHWNVQVAGTVLSFAFAEEEPLARLTLPAAPETCTWQGDVLVLSETGEFAIAVNRGVVVSASVDRLMLPTQKFDPDERTVRVRGDGGHFLVYFEWGDDLAVEEDGDRTHVASPGADWPLMLFIAQGPSRALAEAEMDRLKTVNMGEVVAMTQSFQSAQPRIELDHDVDALWNHAHHLHRVNTYEPEPPFIYEWEVPTRADRYASRVIGHSDSIHTVWDWLLIDASRARQEFENYLKSYDPDSSQVALDVAPLGEPVWPTEHRQAHDGRCMVCSHPPLWPEMAWQLYLATDDRSWLGVTYEVAKLNIGWWERERDRDHDGLFEWADTCWPQPWESGCDGSPRFDEPAPEPFACVDLNAQLVIFYRNLVRIAVELGERKEAAEFSKRQDRLAHLVRERLWDAEAGWFYDEADPARPKVRTAAALWAIVAGIPDRRQLEAMIAHLENPEEFATWFPLPSVAADEPSFAPVGWRGPAWPSLVLWTVMGLRHMNRTGLAGRIIRRALDAMAEVLKRDGVVYECYNPLGPEQDDVRMFDFAGQGERVRRYYLGHAPVRAMILSGLLGIEPTRDGLLIDPAAEGLRRDLKVQFRLGKHGYTLEVKRQAPDACEVTLRRGRTKVAQGIGRTLVPRVDIL
jgi:hypothetical protein